MDSWDEAKISIMEIGNKKILQRCCTLGKGSRSYFKENSMKETKTDFREQTN